MIPRNELEEIKAIVEKDGYDLIVEYLLGYKDILLSHLELYDKMNMAGAIDDETLDIIIKHYELRGKIDMLVEKMEKELKALQKEIGTESMCFIYEGLISDLKSLLGKEE